LPGWSGQSAGIEVEAVAAGISTQASAAEVEPAANDSIKQPSNSRSILRMLACYAAKRGCASYRKA
jgi:hypothetical protein